MRTLNPTDLKLGICAVAHQYADGTYCSVSQTSKVKVTLMPIWSLGCINVSQTHPVSTNIYTVNATM